MSTRAVPRGALAGDVAATKARASRRDIARAMVGLASVALAPSARAGGQPIDWLLTSSADADVDLVEIMRASARGETDAGSAAWTAAAKRARTETAVKTTDATVEETREPVDVGATATKFGKLGAILLFADVVTAAIMGKSVLGVAKSLEREMTTDENGNVVAVEKEKVESGDWKDAMADKLMQKLKEKAADAKTDE